MQKKTGAAAVILTACGLLLAGCCARQAEKTDAADERVEKVRREIASKTVRGDWFCRRAPNFPRGGLWKFEKNPITDFVSKDYYYIYEIRDRALEIVPYVDILSKDEMVMQWTGTTNPQLILTHSRPSTGAAWKVELKYVGSEPWLTGEISDGTRVRGHYYVFQLPTKYKCKHPKVTDPTIACRDLHVEYVDVDDKDAANQRPIWNTTVFPLSDRKCAGAESSEGDGDEGPR